MVEKVLVLLSCFVMLKPKDALILRGCFWELYVKVLQPSHTYLHNTIQAIHVCVCNGEKSVTAGELASWQRAKFLCIAAALAWCFILQFLITIIMITVMWSLLHICHIPIQEWIFHWTRFIAALLNKIVLPVNDIVTGLLFDCVCFHCRSTFGFRRKSFPVKQWSLAGKS